MKWVESEIRYLNLARIGLALNVYMVILVWMSFLKSRYDVFEPKYFISLLVLLIFVLRPIQILRHVETRVPFLPDQLSLMAKAIWLGVVGNGAFFLGYGINVRSRRRLGRSVSPLKWKHGRIVALSLCYVILGLLGYFIAISRSGGWKLLLSTLQGRQMISESNSQIFAAMMYLIFAASAILEIYCLKTKRLRNLFFLSATLSLIIGFALGGRSIVVIYLVTIFVIYFYERGTKKMQRMKLLKWVSIFTIIVVLIIVNMGFQRKSIQRGESASIGRFSLLWIGNTFLGEFPQFDWLAILIDNVPSVIPYQYGKTFLEFFPQFIPRMIWPNKPLPIEYRVTRTIAGYESGSPFTIIGEMYLNFQWAGVVFGMFFLGILTKMAYRKFMSTKKTPFSILVYACFFSNLVHFYTRSFAPMLFFFVLSVIPLLIAYWVIEGRVIRTPVLEGS